MQNCSALNRKLLSGSVFCFKPCCEFGILVHDSFSHNVLVKLKLQEGMPVCTEPCFSKDMVLESEKPNKRAWILPHSNEKFGKNLVSEFHIVK